MNESVKNLIDAIASGDATQTESAFQAVMAEKISAKLEDMRVSVAQSMFTPVQEEVEQIDELSSGAIKNYIKAAKDDKAANKDEKESAIAADDHKTASDAQQKINKRSEGIKAAKAKLNA